MLALQHRTRKASRSDGFTLVELLVTIAIIGLMASLILVALFSAQEDAKVARTEAQIAKIHELIMAKWEAFESRPVPVDLVVVKRRPQFSGYSLPHLRLMALREMQRIEMPERKSDLIDPPRVLLAEDNRFAASLRQAYLRSAQASVNGNDLSNWTEENQGSECLYLILSKLRVDGRRAIEFFSEDEIGDTDKNNGGPDGMLEILDAWGQPIEFLRWAPGFVGLPHSSIQPASPWQRVDSNVLLGDMNLSADGNAGDVADPFDMVRADPRWRDYNNPNVPNSDKECYKENDPFALYPLIVSAGPDGQFDILMNDVTGGASGTPAFVDMRYSQTDTPTYAMYNYGGWESTPGAAMPNDPYVPAPTISQDEGRPVFIGRPSPTREGYVDNISNHTLNVN